MKRVLASALFLTLSASTFASTTDLHTAAIQNSQVNETFVLNAQTTRTMYRTEERMSTCWRQVYAGTRQVCDSAPININSVIVTDQVGPHPDPGSHPDDPGRVSKPTPDDPSPSWPSDPRPVTCYNQDYYRDEAYSCIETVTIPYEVFDHNSTANVNVAIAAAPASKPQSTDCGISFSLTGDSLSAVNLCSDYVATATSSVVSQGYVKNYNYTINLLDAAVVLAPLAGNLENLKVTDDELTVKTGSLVGAQNFTLKLYVQRRKFLSKDVVLVNRVLTAKEFTYKAIDEKTGLVHINLDKLLGGFESTKKHVLKVELDVTLPTGTMAGSTATRDLHQEATITINK